MGKAEAISSSSSVRDGKGSKKEKVHKKKSASASAKHKSGDTTTNNHHRTTSIASLHDTLRKNFKKLRTLAQSSQEEKKQQQNDIEATRVLVENCLVECQQCLDKLFLMTVSVKTLEETKIGKIVKKFSRKCPPLPPLGEETFDAIVEKRKVLIQDASTLSKTWMALAIGVEGETFELLRLFRSLVKKLTDERRAKPDMVARKQLRGHEKYGKRASLRIHGALPDVNIGTIVHGRGEVAIVGLHLSILSGIDAVKGEACYAVCISGKYDDEELEGGKIIYTGMGGLDKKGVQIEDQKENIGNVSLIMSWSSGTPIRVIRRVPDSIDYVYEGLYKCTDYTYKASSGGPKVYKFTLVPIPDQTTYPLYKKRGELKRANTFGVQLG